MEKLNSKKEKNMEKLNLIKEKNMENLNSLKLNFFNQVKKFLSSQINTNPDMEHNINYQISMNPMCLKVDIENSYCYTCNAKIIFDENNNSFILEDEEYNTDECTFSYSEFNEVVLSLQKFHEELLNLIDALNKRKGE